MAELTYTVRTLPKHIGGYQHLAPDIVPTATDILVLDGEPMVFAGQCLAFDTVEQLEAHYCARVYRKIPVAKPGDTDEGWKKIRAGASSVLAPSDEEIANGFPRSPAAIRKGRPVATGVLDYFPDALLAVAEVSRIGNEQHHPGKPLHWDRSKSTDESDALIRHFIERGTLDTDGSRHSAKVAWRALALLQREIESARAPRT